MSDNGSPQQMVTLKVDGIEVRVPKGTNLIKAAQAAGIEIPFYCYHPHLSVPGNCRMCQVEVKGAPKLMIGCHTQVQEGMEVCTHNTSAVVAEAQASTLEFILINHPLDCTVCDQAGHCKLQDYHFEYNARSSRFVENKVQKVKAEPLGPHVILDGERCIMCTRCIRFCDEITGTSELGMLNRGDRSVIAVQPGKELNNPLSGTVVDLCPVGALTHRDWRFNTRIWYTKQTPGICPGCSTGCNVKVAVRDRQVVQVKARINDEVNKEWLCDEGRYGFERFLPAERQINSELRGQVVDFEQAIKPLADIKGQSALVFLSPDLLLEEYYLIKKWLEKCLPQSQVAVAYRKRHLSPVESILVSPDYAANYRAAEFVGLLTGDPQSSYESALGELREGKWKNVICLGDRSILPEDLVPDTLTAIANTPLSFGTVCAAQAPLTKVLQIALPARSILEKSGLMLNVQKRLQYTERFLDFPLGTQQEWRVINACAKLMGAEIVSYEDDRALTLAVLDSEEAFAGLSIAEIKRGGVSLSALNESTAKEFDSSSVGAA